MELKPFMIIFGVSQVIGILAVIFVVAAAGLAGKHGSKEFLWHPILMILSFGYFYGTSITVFRVLRYLRKIHLKRLHAAIHFAVIIFGIAGVAIAFDSNYGYAPKSLHSILGLVTLILFCIQWVVSFLMLYFPKASESIRSSVMPYHVIGGLVLFGAAVCTILIGINSYIPEGGPEIKFGVIVSDSTRPQRVLLIFAGFFFLIYALLVGFMVLKQEYKREPTDDDAANSKDSVAH